MTSFLGTRYVRCNQFYHGLQIFYADIVFGFNASDINNHIGVDTVVHISASLSPNVPPHFAGLIFSDQISRDFWYRDSVREFQRAGFDAELGFYDANTTAVNAPRNFVLAWKLTVSGRPPYPVAYIRADEIALRYYWNGVIID